KYPDIEIPSVGVYQYVISNPYNVPDNKDIFIDGITDERVTFGELKRDSKRFAAGLQDRIGFKRGTVTAANPKYTAREFASQLITSGASVIIVHPKYLDTAIKAAKEAGIPESRIFLFGNREVHGFQSYRSLIGDREAEPVSYSPEEAKNTTAFLCYSSGTTGIQKAVEITHTNIIANMAQILSSGYFNTRNIFTGALVNFIPNVYYLKKAINFVYTVPPMILALVRFPSIESLSSVEIIFSGAAPLSDGLIDDFYKLYKIPIRQGY
ncbi:14720_t:CDS:2, partial [Racocetra fulgida]